MNIARRKVTVIGTGNAVDAAHAALEAVPGCEVRRGDAALPGATVVVVDEEVKPGRIAARAPDARVVVLGDAGAVDGLLAATAFTRARVLGAGAAAASIVASAALAAAADVAAQDARVLVLGGSGSAAVPALSLATIGGAPAAAVLGEARVAEAVGAALAAPPSPFVMAAAAVEVVAAILLDARRVLACGVACHGEYGIGGAAVGVPVIVGAAGAERVLELPLSADEHARLGRAAGV